MGTLPKVAVIGRGLMGSAAAKYLARAGLEPTVIGPEEPKVIAEHRGVFGSHYDEGRITRKNATDPYWAEASIVSIARYAEIERASGIRFFSPVGALMAGEDSGPFLGQAREVAAEFRVDCEDHNRDGLAHQIPSLNLPEGWSALWERSDSGHLSPRRLVEAQTKIADASGAKFVSAPAAGIEEASSEVSVLVGEEARAFDFVLVAAGGMTDHVLGREPKYRVCGRTVTFFELSESEAEAHSNLPSLVMGTDEGHYLLPPIRYPDGKVYMKLGGDPDDLILISPEEIGNWFRTGGRETAREHQEAWFRSLFPDVSVESISTAACMTTWTNDLRPEICSLSERVHVVSAGNGAGAKCSDELGRRGAALITELLEKEL